MKTTLESIQNKTVDGKAYMLKKLALERVEFAILYLSGLACSPTPPPHLLRPKTYKLMRLCKINFILSELEKHHRQQDGEIKQKQEYHL